MESGEKIGEGTLNSVEQMTKCQKQMLFVGTKQTLYQFSRQMPVSQILSQNEGKVYTEREREREREREILLACCFETIQFADTFSVLMCFQ